MDDPRDKIRKLIALATNEAVNDGEALNAFRAAFAIAKKHNIDVLVAPAHTAHRPAPLRHNPDSDWAERYRRDANAYREREANDAQRKRDQARATARGHQSPGPSGNVHEHWQVNAFAGQCMTCNIRVEPMRGFVITVKGQQRTICSRPHAPQAS